MRDALWGVRCVWLRYFVVFRKSLVYYLVTTFLEPILTLLAFGLGVGSLVGALHTEGMTVSYRAFVFAGVISQALLFQGFFEGGYGAFVRMYYQRIFQAMATTPITLPEVLWGELLWDTTKAVVAAEVVALIGVVTGDLRPWAPLALLPLCAASGLLFSAMGLTAAAYSRTIEELSFPQLLIVMPMFLFCGVFFPVDTLPAPLRAAAWALPLTSVGSLARTLALGFPFQARTVPILAAWLVALVVIGRRAMLRRLVK